MARRGRALGIAVCVLLAPPACGRDEPIRAGVVAPWLGSGAQRSSGGGGGLRCYTAPADDAGVAGQSTGGEAGSGVAGDPLSPGGSGGGDESAGGAGGAPPVCPAPWAAGGMPADDFGFFVFGDSRTFLATFERSVRNMIALDPAAVAAFTTGDLTETGDTAEWDAHQAALACGAPDPCVPADPLGIVRQSRFRTDVGAFGPYVRYLAALGNHDLLSLGWFERWNRYLPGQRHLGVNAEDGIYFHLTIGNALFIVLDSNHPSDEQTTWLEAVLSAPETAGVRFRFALFHDPIYPCDAKPPAAWLMPWVEIFERYGLDVAFVSHSHTYERTCAMRGGHCAAGGVVYLDTGTVAAPPRDVFPTLSGTVVGTTRTDDYDCREILESSLGLANQFCHLRIQGCQATTRCYTFDAPETGAEPFDTWVLDRC